MKQESLYLIAGILILLIIVYRLIAETKNQKKRLKVKLKNEYGEVPEKTITEEDFQKIRMYFDSEKTSKEFYVDDITWNDFDMDRIFQRMNRTYSSPGEEVLYDMVRSPLKSGEALKERADLIAYLDENEALRLKLQEIFVHTGKTKKYSMLWYLERLKEVETKGKFERLYHLLLTLISIGLFFVKPVIGILAFIGVMIFNFITYYRGKAEIEPYYVSLFAMRYLLESSENLLKLEDAKLQEMQSELGKDIKTLRPLISSTRWLGGSGKFSVAGNILDIFVDYIRLMSHMDLYKFDRATELLKNQEKVLRKVFQKMGYLEALIAIGSFRKTLAYFVVPERHKDSEILAEEMYHPLTHKLVPNTLKEKKSVLLTGSNASGKSTFLRMVGLSEIFAETIVTVPAKKFSSGFYHVYSSMALRDNVVGGESYFIVEIKSLKRILDAVERGEPVLCIVDEVLRGTNTAERIATSSSILRDLSLRGTKVFAATHDMELTELLKDVYVNYHFEEQVTDNQVRFDYQLLKGPSKTRNAIKLLRMMGYPEKVVEEAEEAATEFLKQSKQTE